jgi:membrane protease YdiL (CAAX protease family)
MKTLAQKHTLTIFFILAIGLTWIFMISDALGSHGILPFRLPMSFMVVMGYMPTLAAVLVTQWTTGWEGVRALFKKLLIARVGLGWYLFAIFGMAVIYPLSIALYNLFSGAPAISFFSEDLPQGPAWRTVLSLIPIFIVLGIVNGEELAWRGFAIPHLQRRYNALTSSIIMGLLWSLFHVPLFFTLTGSSQVEMNFITFTLGTVSLSILYTGMLNHTRGSVLLAYLFHASQNTWSRVFNIDHSHGGDYVPWILLALATAILFVYGTEDLSHKPTRITE